MGKEQRYRIDSIFQAGQVLKLIADSKEPLGPSEVAKLADLTNNTAFRMCVTLEELGFLKQIGEKYELGMGLALFWARKKASLEGEKERVEKDIKSLEEDEYGKQ